MPAASIPAKTIVLILCTGNSCRSHIGEGLLRSIAGDTLNLASAGSKPAGYVHPMAIEVMAEIGIDISSHESKSLEQFLNQPVHTVLTVCGNVDQICPVFPGQIHRIHQAFDDPAHAAGSPQEIRETFRRVRDEMNRYLKTFASELVPSS